MDDSILFYTPPPRASRCLDIRVPWGGGIVYGGLSRSLFCFTYMRRGLQ